MQQYKQPPQGAVVSDLHLFTNRTTVHEHMPEIKKAADECELFVFNGDIFDFHWSLYDGYKAAVSAAENWICDLCDKRPGTRFVFVLGNHDSIPAYAAALESMSLQKPNIEWRKDWYRVDDKLFLHGDVYHAGSNPGGVAAYRTRCNIKLKRNRFRHSIYWAFARSGLPVMFLLMVSKKTCAKRILDYLESELGDQIDQIKEIFFGHIHSVFTNFKYDNILFHNTGSATKGARLSVIRFALNRLNPDFAKNTNNGNSKMGNES